MTKMMGGSGFGGVTVIEVEPGTEIEYEGQKHVVTGATGVLKGHNLYITSEGYRALRKSVKERS